MLTDNSALTPGRHTETDADAELLRLRDELERIVSDPQAAALRLLAAARESARLREERDAAHDALEGRLRADVMRLREALTKAAEVSADRARFVAQGPRAFAAAELTAKLAEAERERDQYERDRDRARDDAGFAERERDSLRAQVEAITNQLHSAHIERDEAVQARAAAREARRADRAQVEAMRPVKRCACGKEFAARHYDADCPEHGSKRPGQGRCDPSHSDYVEPSILLRNLLARIHRDDGSHTAEVGLERSAQDADKRVAELNARSDYGKATESHLLDAATLRWAAAYIRKCIAGHTATSLRNAAALAGLDEAALKLEASAERVARGAYPYPTTPLASDAGEWHTADISIRGGVAVAATSSRSDDGKADDEDVSLVRLPDWALGEWAKTRLLHATGDVPHVRYIARELVAARRTIKAISDALPPSPGTVVERVRAVCEELEAERAVAEWSRTEDTMAGVRAVHWFPGREGKQECWEAWQGGKRFGSAPTRLALARAMGLVKGGGGRKPAPGAT